MHKSQKAQHLVDLFTNHVVLMKLSLNFVAWSSQDKWDIKIWGCKDIIGGFCSFLLMRYQTWYMYMVLTGKLRILSQNIPVSQYNALLFSYKFFFSTGWDHIPSQNYPAQHIHVCNVTAKVAVCMYLTICSLGQNDLNLECRLICVKGEGGFGSNNLLHQHLRKCAMTACMA